VQQHQFELLARLLEQPQWLQDPRFADAETRRANATAMQTELSAVLRTRDAADWEHLLSSAGIPCGMVRDIGEAMSLPQLEQRGLRLPVHIPGLPQREDVAVLGPGFVSGTGAAVPPEPPPRLGEHTAQIRAWLKGGRNDPR
jgi:crotonobetainyl-CoA:carnitine CoA-transferase CaiB-like acyl-CoA transferase